MVQQAVRTSWSIHDQASGNATVTSHILSAAFGGLKNIYPRQLKIIDSTFKHKKIDYLFKVNVC
jgi:hypothetical protein